MKTLNISISDVEFAQFGVGSEKLTFSEFLELISKELMRQNLNRCVELAAKYGLSKTSMDEITSEVNAVRSNAKNSN